MLLLVTLLNQAALRKVGGPFVLLSLNVNIYLDAIDWIARLDLKDQNLLEPGHSGRVYVTFPYQPQCLIGRLREGKTFLLREGSFTIGSGIILSLINFTIHAQQALHLFGPCDNPFSV